MVGSVTALGHAAGSILQMYLHAPSPLSFGILEGRYGGPHAIVLPPNQSLVPKGITDQGSTQDHIETSNAEAQGLMEFVA